jgi:hypothetical protein
MMARFYMKMLGFGLLLLFCIFFGVSLATSGIERIHGSLTPNSLDPGRVSPSAIEAVNTSQIPSSNKEKKLAIPSKTQEIEPADIQDRSLNLVGNKLGDLLQIVSHHGIKWVVSIFDAVLGKG